MRFAAGLSPLCSGPLCPPALPVGLSTPHSSHPAWMCALPPAHLWVSEGLQAHFAGNSRRIPAICLLDSWRSWLFAFPSVSGT